MPSLSSERTFDACEDIIANAQAALDFTADMSFAAFEADQKTQYAVVRCLEIISEASRRIDSETKARHPDIPWRDIADAGNLYRHAYHRVALDIVWKTVHDLLTPIVAACHAELRGPPTP
ncbi:HepT-like ribonuclease domain-containing protein [Methylobacterium sp. Leaf117]|uniref:HepT-like ribonuclease domain-containing protein n=1 Tax=Methylobacterium sp. Leaf117 TaxID=1736260 RepID=UPI0006FEC158|nr:HepT-like ribonuclease domain-containing protein [Methylobacterium sp. Leaf117]KQP82790.1 hypothetical protein ASF57_11645 [Methylobacterium sp. Leaf117]